MVFSSTLFLFGFLPLVLTAYLLVSLLGRACDAATGGAWRVRLQNLTLLAASLLFYAWGEGGLVLVLVGSATLDFLCVRGMAAVRARGGPAWRVKAWLWLSVVGNLAVLGYFKYAGFVAENLGADWKTVALPLGISFYTFQSLSYTVDAYRGRVAPADSYGDFLCYVSLFPQLVAGPIVRYADVAAELKRRTSGVADVVAGMERLVVGLGKKVLVANTLAGPVDTVFALPAGQVTPALAWLACVGYALQIYCDFSGYTDMAVGLGRMLGFRFPENFFHPYAAASVRDFWRRWHVTLSTWFRDYLYIPLGGNRGTPLRTAMNLFLVFALCGLWHGAGWPFLLWGLWHGAWLSAERLGLGDRLERRGAFAGWTYATAVVLAGWVLFRSETLAQAGTVYAALLGRPAAEPYLELADLLTADVALALLAGAALSGPWPGRVWQRVSRWRPTAGLAVGVRQAALSATLLASAATLASGTHNPFIYFRF